RRRHTRLQGDWSSDVCSSDLFLGPTGSGKTHVVEAAAEILFGDRNAVIRIDCAEFQHSHEIAKLIGSPPGYLGHRETAPLLTQRSEERRVGKAGRSRSAAEES